MEADVTQGIGTVLPEGWALKSSKTAKRFNNAQKSYLEEKFRLGQATGCKLDPATVAMDMRSSRNKEGVRQFSATEFLSQKQVQSFFSRMASKLRHGKADENDIIAAEEQQAYEETRTLVLREVQLRHPIVFDTFNLCDLHKSGKINQLSVPMLRTVCENFDLPVEAITKRRKSPYLSLLKELIDACDVCHV
jgi:Arf-GAP/Rho-GAP domain/ANK repeat/PH domain-containing protein 3